MSIIKTRDSGYDATVRELSISSRGAELGAAVPVQGDEGKRGSTRGGWPTQRIGRLFRKRERQP